MLLESSAVQSCVFMMVVLRKAEKVTSCSVSATEGTGTRHYDQNMAVMKLKQTLLLVVVLTLWRQSGDTAVSFCSETVFHSALSVFN